MQGQLDVHDEEGWQLLVLRERLHVGADRGGFRQLYVLGYVVDLLLERVRIHTYQPAAAPQRPPTQQHRAVGLASVPVLPPSSHECITKLEL